MRPVSWCRPPNTSPRSGICDQHGVPLIADEIQSGLGRTGTTFACDLTGNVPDTYILGKAVGGGVVPVSAIEADRDVLSVIRPGQHGSTFGGNPRGSAHDARQ